MNHHIRSLIVAASFTSLTAGPGLAQSESDLRDTEVVQSVYLRTLSVDPSAALVRDAQMAFDLAVRTYGATDSRTADMAVNLGRALNGTGQSEAAVPLLESALSIYNEADNQSKLRYAMAQYQLGVAHSGAENAEAAIAALTAAYTVLEPNLRRLSADTSFIREALQSAGGAQAVSAAETAAAGTAAMTTVQPRPTLQIPPIYPPDESAEAIDGWVLLDYRLWPDGGVRDVYVLAASPENVFDISAAMALQQWRFENPTSANQHHQLSVAFDAQ
ncbi:MAG: TonB family protein [Alphaproteobacteria bacterium]|nr:TonB family protein [Alphaproteobacteria bacterium]